MRQGLALILLMMSAWPAQAQGEKSDPLIGWWRATLSHNGETDDFYLHIKRYKDQLGASFSIPSIRAHDSPLSLVKATDKTVEFPALHWTLTKEAGGTVLAGVTPADLLPYYKLNARFERSEPPPERSEPSPATEAPTPLWKRSIGAPVYAGLTYDAARKTVLVAMDSGNVSALRASDGSILWTADAGAPVRATPTVSGAHVYVATDAAVVKLDARTGRKLWSGSFDPVKVKRLPLSDPQSRWDFYASSAVPVGSLVYAGSLDGCVHAFASSSGSRVRSYCATDSITGTPLIDGNRIYFGSFDGKVYAARLSDGAALWNYDTHGAVTSDLGLADGKLIVGSRSYDLTALDPISGKPAWTRYFWFSWVESSPSVVGTTVYIGSSDGLRASAFDGRSGGRLWQTLLPGWSWAKPAVGRSTVYASVAGTDQPYIGKREGAMAAIDRHNGKLRWLMRAPKREKAAVYGFAAAPVLASGRVFAADVDGNVFAFRED